MPHTIQTPSEENALYKALIEKKIKDIDGKLDELHLEDQAVEYAIEQARASKMSKMQQISEVSRQMGRRQPLSASDFLEMQKRFAKQTVNRNDLEEIEVKLTDLDVEQQAIAIAIDENRATRAALMVELTKLTKAREMRILAKEKGEAAVPQQLKKGFEEEFELARGFDDADDDVFCPQVVS